MTENLLLLPFYVLADVSYSMTQPSAPGGESSLDALNQAIVSVRDSIDENPLLKDKIRFSLIDFSDDARVQIPMCDFSQIREAELPVLVARGGTSFAAAFTTLRQQIDVDIRQLKADGVKVHRPAVFFLTDGEPTDADDVWRQSYADLTSSTFRARPNIIPFGVGDARQEVLEQITFPAGRMRTFIVRDGVKAGDAIRSMAEVLIGSILASANSVSSDGETGGFVLPDDDEDDVWL